jgi:TatD DNase family protein
MFIDTHCHLNFKDFASDRNTIIANAKRAGVKKMIVPGVDQYFSEEAVRLSDIFPNEIYASAGFHPYESEKTDHRQAIKFLENLIQNNKIVALGECGLDYHLYKGHEAVSKKEKQQILFEAHLYLALKYNLPVIIHCRDAFADIFAVLERMPAIPRGVFHCFGGGLSDLREALKRNYYIGIDGNVTYSKTTRLIVQNTPINKLFLETDSPYLSPIPFRGKRNEPKNIPLIAKSISIITGIGVKVIEKYTTANVSSLLKIPL